MTQYDEFYRSLLALSDNIADCSGQTNRESNSSRPFLQTAKPISFIHIHNETTHYISFRIRLRLYGIFIQVTVSSPFLALITTAILAVCTKTTAEKKNQLSQILIYFLLLLLFTPKMHQSSNVYNPDFLVFSLPCTIISNPNINHLIFLLYTEQP